MRISDWSSDVCSSDLVVADQPAHFVVDGDRLVHAEAAGVAGVVAVRAAHRAVQQAVEAVAHQLPRARIGFARGAATGAQPPHQPLRQHQAHGGGKQERFDAHVPESRSEEHTSELQSLMSISYAVFCLKKKKYKTKKH